MRLRANPMIVKRFLQAPKRKIVPLNLRKQLLSELGIQLRKKGEERYARLHGIGWYRGVGFDSNIHTFNFHGIPVAVKDTQMAASEGLDFNKVRRAMLVHQKAVRQGIIKPKNYSVRTPKVYGVIDNKYLVMEQVQDFHNLYSGKTAEAIETEHKTNPWYANDNWWIAPKKHGPIEKFLLTQARDTAYKELKKNFELLKEKGLLKEFNEFQNYLPQIWHFMLSGQQKGKFLLYAVYDFQ